MRKIFFFGLLFSQLLAEAQLTQHELFDESLYKETWKALPIDWQNDGVMDLVTFDYSTELGTEDMVLYVNDGNGVLSFNSVLSEVWDPFWSFDIQRLTHVDIDDDGVWEVLAENWFELFRLDYELADPQPYRMMGTNTAAWNDPIQLNLVSPWLVDYDDDGDLDIAALTNGEEVWLINENGFELELMAPRSGFIRWPSDDWNGDGLGDYYGVSPSQTPGYYRIKCYFQNTDGTFDVSGGGLDIYQFPSSGPTSHVFEDLNDDGLKDVVLITNNEVRYALRQAGGSFGSVQPLYNLSNTGYKRFFTDFDGDGDKDIVLNSVNYSELQDYVLLNNGNAGFGSLTAMDQTFIRNALILDLDGSNGLDYVGLFDSRSPFAHFTVQLQFEDDFNGSFQSIGQYLGFISGEDPKYSLSDLDQNGEMDIYRSSSHYPYSGVVIKSAYTNHPSFHPVQDDGYFYFLIDRDPLLENEVLAYYWQANNFMVNYGVLNMNTYAVEVISETTIPNSSGFLISPTTLDLNNDGEMDLLLDHDGYLSTYGNPVILLANADGSFEVMELPTIQSETVLFAGCFDLNDDGQYEYYLADGNQTYRMIYDNTGNWSDPEVVFELPLLLKHEVIDEINGQHYMVAAMYSTNAWLDYFVELSSDGSLSNLRSLRDPAFPNSPWTVNACFDIDGDGFKELVSTSYHSTEFWITDFKDNEVQWQTYDVQQRQFYGSALQHYNIADINGDGALDMYVSDNPFFEWIKNEIPLGCTDPMACNYSTAAIHNVDLCCYSNCGCTDVLACNYDSNATCDNGSCVEHGCTNPAACNFDPNVSCDDGSCNLDAVNLTFEISSEEIDITQSMFSISFQSESGYPEPYHMSLMEYGTNVLTSTFQCVGNDCYSLAIAPIAGYIEDAQVEFQLFDNTGTLVMEESNTMEGLALAAPYLEAGLVFCVCGSEEIPGCTDVQASNYSAVATCENGSCQYPIHGRVFHDTNANGIFDGEDYGLAFQQVVINPDNMLVYTDDQGYYSIDVGQGNFELTHVASDVFPYYTTALSYSGLSQWLHTSELDFGISAVVPVAEICLDIYPAWYLCDDIVQFNLCFRNLGNYTVSGSLAFTYDDLMLGHVEITPIESVNGNTVYFSFENLLPGEMFFYAIGLHTPNFELMGENVTFSGEIEGYLDNTLAATGYKTLVMEHACSYDPNDKNGYPLGFTESHFVEDGTAIEYVVRFQNTGNAPALNVRIEDELDPNVDLSTFELVANSHSVMTVLDEDERRVVFYFNNIMLPDSATDEPGSNGLVSYRVSLADPLPTGTQIHNTASIYFDNNPAVITNTTLHTIYNCEEFSVDVVVDDSQWCSNQTVDINATVPWADAYMWMVNGQLMSESTELLINSSGEKQITLMVDNPLCGLYEETLTLNLEEVLIQSIQASATTVCEGETVDLSAVETSDSYLWSSNGNTISIEDNIQVSASGTYQLTTTNGLCQQTNSINIVVTPLPEANITQSLNVLSTQANANWTYQWYMNDELIMGATSSTYEIEASGMYQVVVMNGSCEQSAEINASYINVEENVDASWSWYPNPVVDELTLTCTADQMDQLLELVDVTGRVVYSVRITQSQLRIDTSKWSSGVYTIRTDDGTTIGRVIKK